MRNAVQTVNFHGHKLWLVAHNDEPHVAMKPVCEAIGLQWEAQYKRIKRHSVLATCVSIMDMQLPGDIQRRAMVVLPLQYLNGWLFGIDASRVKPEIRERLVQYQRECFQALYDYWSKGVAKRHDGLTDEQRQILNEVIRHSAIRAADPVRHNACVAIDKKLRERFGSPIPAERFEEAVEYVNSLDHRDIYHLPEAQARAISERLERLANTFHPFSEQFAAVIGVLRALRGLHPCTGTVADGYRPVIPMLEGGQQARHDLLAA